MPYELIALDLDDTLLRADLSISPANRQALREATEAGIRVVLASGRNIHSMLRYARDLGIDLPGEYMICTNGAEIVETATALRVHARTLDGPFCREVAAVLAEKGFPWQVYEDGLIKGRSRHAWSELDTSLTGQPFVVIPEDELPGLLDRGQTKFLVPGAPADISRLHAELSLLFGDRAEVVISKPYFLEILAPGADKGVALERLCAILGLDPANTMAAGDAMNDLGMLGAAGLACVPANAIPEAKARAGWVSELTNEEDFVADVVKRFLLAPSPKKAVNRH